jgi:hypothetical protein
VSIALGQRTDDGAEPLPALLAGHLLFGIVGGIRNRVGDDVALRRADVALPLFERQIMRDAKQPALEIAT